MDTITRSEGIEKIAELIKDLRIAMLVTLDDQGRPSARPMATQETPFDGTLWFFTSVTSGKVHDVVNNPRVNVVYANSSAESYLSVSGRASIVDDRHRMRDLWTPFLRAWFENADDPDLRLLRVDVEDAEYWDTPGGKIASLISLVKGAITGNGENMQSDNQQVRF